MYTEGIFSERKRERTEWEDVQTKFGNFAPPPEEPEDPEIIYDVDDGATKLKSLESAKTLEDVDALEDEFDDDRFFENYRQKRLLELQKKAARSKYGEVRHIKAPEYSTEVSNKDLNDWVVCHVFKPAVPHCQLLNKLLVPLAARFKETKFVKIYSHEAIPGYPDRNLPTLLIYHKGEMKRQFVTLSSLGGVDIDERDLEWILKNVGCVASEMERNPRFEDDEEQTKRNRSGIDFGYITRLDDDDEW